MRVSDHLLRVPEAAELLGLRPSTVRRLIARGQLAIVRPTRRAVRVPASEVERILRNVLRLQPEGGVLSGGGDA